MIPKKTMFTNTLNIYIIAYAGGGGPLYITQDAVPRYQTGRVPTITI